MFNHPQMFFWVCIFFQIKLIGNFDQFLMDFYFQIFYFLPCVFFLNFVQIIVGQF